VGCHEFKPQNCPKKKSKEEKSETKRKGRKKKTLPLVPSGRESTTSFIHYA
jgi:hypothetical protein